MCRHSAEKLRLAADGVILRALRGCQDRIYGGIAARAIRLNAVERASGGKAFQHPLIDGARINAAAEIPKVGKSALAARRDDGLDRLAAPRTHRRQRVRA